MAASVGRSVAGSLKIKMTVTDTFTPALAALGVNLPEATRRAVWDVGERLKVAMRTKVARTIQGVKGRLTRAKLKDTAGVNKAIRGRSSPRRRGEGGEARYEVFSKIALKPRKGLRQRPVDLILQAQTGATIGPSKQWLAIPNRAVVPRRGTGRFTQVPVTPAEWRAEGQEFFYRPARNGNAVLLTRIDGRTVLAYTLIRQVVIKKRLDFSADIAKANKQLGPAIESRVKRFARRDALGFGRKVERSVARAIDG